MSKSSIGLEKSEFYRVSRVIFEHHSVSKHYKNVNIRQAILHQQSSECARVRPLFPGYTIG